MKVDTDELCHVQQRALERYGVLITINDIRDMTQTIISGRAKVFHKVNNYITVYVIEINETTMYPLFSHKIGYIKTIVTKSMVNKWKKQEKRIKRLNKRYGKY